MNEGNCREMTLEEVIEEMRGMICDVNVEEINAHEGESLREWTLRWGNKMMNLLAAVEKKTPNFFGMTVEAERRVMRNAVRLIREVVDDYVFGCDSGNEEWREYFTGYSDELDEEVEKAERPSDFCYQLPSDEWLFKNLISWGTSRGGMGSACEECSKIGKIMKGEE